MSSAWSADGFATKVAGWLGTRTVTESKADNYATESTAILSNCLKRYSNRTQPEAEKCFSQANEDFSKADQLYAQDCNQGNKAACRKQTTLREEWRSILNSGK